MKRLLLLLNFIILQNVSAQNPFVEVPPQDKPTTLIIPKGLHYKVLFSEGDSVYTSDGKIGKAKGWHDMVLTIPDKNNSSIKLAVSHECNDSSNVLGDGGGMSIIPLRLTNEEWAVNGKILNIDFTTVGGTYDNCSGTLVEGKNTILSAEEGTPDSNDKLQKKGKGYRDVSDFNNLPRYKHTGWMVEVDPNTNKAIHKLYSMGRFVHESALVMPDGKTVFLTDDYAPCIFFKFVSDTKNDFTKGQLYAYKESTVKDTSHWIKLPMQLDSLVQIRNVALRMGATYFLRMEWMTLVNNKIYITETGYDGFLEEKLYDGKAAKHLKSFSLKPGLIDHPYGSILEFDLATNDIRVLLDGGAGKTKHFANPDAITNVTIKGKTYLIISEDIFNSNRGRASEAALNDKSVVNEIYWLDLSIKDPTVEDLKRFVIAPLGSETTGGAFIKNDSKYYFFNVQHPDSSNPPPFNKSCTVVIDLGK